MRRLWVGFWIGAGHQKEQAMIRSLEFSASLPILQRGEELEMELTDHGYARKLPQNPNSTGQKLLYLGPSQTLPHVSLHLAVHLYPLSYALINW